MAARLKLFADLAVVVDFAVEGDCRVAVVSDNRLVAAGKIDDFQANGAESGEIAFEDALLVGAAVVQDFRQAPGKPRARGLPNPRKPRDSTHLAYPRMLSNISYSEGQISHQPNS